MTFEASISTHAGGVTAKLIPDANRVLVEVQGMVTRAEIEQTTPRLLQHLANRSGLPVRHGGRCYYPRPTTARNDAQAWGEA